MREQNYGSGRDSEKSRHFRYELMMLSYALGILVLVLCSLIKISSRKDNPLEDLDKLQIKLENVINTLKNKPNDNNFELKEIFNLVEQVVYWIKRIENECPKIGEIENLKFPDLKMFEEFLIELEKIRSLDSAEEIVICGEKYLTCFKEARNLFVVAKPKIQL